MKQKHIDILFTCVLLTHIWHACVEKNNI